MVKWQRHRNLFNTQWGKSVVAERFIKTLKNKFYKFMTSTSKIMYIDKLNNTVNDKNNAYQNIYNEGYWS